MNFNVTASVSNFLTKPNTEEIKRIEYIRRNLSLDEISDFIKKGYVLSANFTEDNTSIITQIQRTYENLTGTNFLMIDLDDDVKCSLTQLIDELRVKPTIAYTTYSHQKESKGNRYRLLYFFKEEISNSNIIKELYNNIVDINKLSISDNCGRNCVQAIFGSHSECELINTELTYSINQFSLPSGLSNSIKKEKESNIELESPIQDKEYISDYWNMSYTDLIAKYNDKYHFFQHTPLEQVDDDTPYILLPSNYLEIKRYWIYTTNYNENDEVRNITSKARTIKDGESRKKILYLNGILRRLMIGGLSFEHLLHCLVNELYHFIDNTKDKIDKKQLIKIAKSSYNADLERYIGLNKERDKRRFIVNQKYCIKYGLNKKQVRNLSRKVFTNNRIGELYDNSLTDKANIEVFKEYGLDISTKTLQRFRKEMGITKYQNGNGLSKSIKEKRESNIELESPTRYELDKPYYDYQSELVLLEIDEGVATGYYDMKDAYDIKVMARRFIKKAKIINPNYSNQELIEMFKEHYNLAS